MIVRIRTRDEASPVFRRMIWRLRMVRAQRAVRRSLPLAEAFASGLFVGALVLVIAVMVSPHVRHIAQLMFDRLDRF